MTWARGSTRSSRALRDRTLRLWPTCYLQYDGCTGASTEDDHVICIAEGGTDHPDNHRGACTSCHKVKSQGEAARGSRRYAEQRTRQRPPEPHPGLVI